MGAYRKWMILGGKYGNAASVSPKTPNACNTDDRCAKRKNLQYFETQNYL